MSTTDHPLDRPLTVPILVGGSFDHPLVVLPLIVGALFLVLGLLVEATGGGGHLLLVAAGLLVPGLIAAAILGARRRWLEVTLAGFVLHGPGGREVVLDEQVLWLRRRRRNSPPRGTRHIVMFGYEGPDGPRRARLTYRVLPAVPEVDPLSPLWTRVVAALAGRARFGGEGWSVDADGLRVARGGAVESANWAELAKARMVGEHLQVWRTNDVLPWLRLPREGENVEALHALLHHRLPHAPLAPEAHSLGRWLFERRDRYLLKMSGWLAGIGLLVVCASCLHPLTIEGGIVGAFLLLLALVTAVKAFPPALQVHERGLRQAHRGHTRSLLYSEVGGLLWASDVIEFLPWDDLHLPPIHTCDPAPNTAPLMVELRDFVAGCVGERWLAELREGRPVTWRSRLRFLPSGLEVGPWPLVCGRVVLSYDVLRYHRADGVLVLRGRAGEELMRVPPDTMDFHVGLYVLRRLTKPSAPTAAPEGAVFGTAPRLAPGPPCGRSRLRPHTLDERIRRHLPPRTDRP